MQKVLVVTPTYNEADNIEEFVGKVFDNTKNLPDFNVDILVVDGNSPDGTSNIVETLKQTNPRLNLLVETKKEGLGRAYGKGFRWGLDRGYDLIIEMDADMSHDPKYLPEMLERSKTADLVIGSRYVKGGGTVDWGLLRRLISFGASLYTRIIAGLPIYDVTGGYKCFQRKVLETVPFEKVQASGYGFQIEMNYRVWKAGFMILEFPIIFPDRQKGVSKLDKKIFVEAFLLVWRLRFNV